MEDECTVQCDCIVRIDRGRNALSFVSGVVTGYRMELSSLVNALAFRNQLILLIVSTTDLREANSLIKD